MFQSPLSGVLFFIFLAAVPIAFLLNLLVQLLYRRAIARAMRHHDPNAATGFSVPPARGPDKRTLQIETGGVMPSGSLRIGLALRYALAAAAFACVQMTIYFVLQGIEFGPNRSGIVVAIILTPAVPFCLHVAGLSRRWIWAGTALWIGLLYLKEPASFALLGILIGPVAITGLVLANRVFRTTALALYLIALTLIVPLLFALDLALQIVPVFGAAALPMAGIGLFVCGLILAWLAARMIAWVSRGASDLMLQSYAIWFMMSLWQATLMSGDVGLPAALSFISLLAHALVLWALSVLLRRSAGPSTLFLRVFGQRRLQAKFSAGPMTDWRQSGPIMLIGSADLATDTLDMDELAAFLSGRTADLFISNAKDLSGALTAADTTAHDGLFPVHDYYCQEATWRPTVEKLMHRASRVVLDLRGFSAENRGVQYEINALVARIDLANLTVLVDDSTDQALACDLFQTAWRDTHGDTEPDHVTLQFLGLERAHHMPTT